MKYRYLGRRGIFIEGKHYHTHDIVETDKRIEEISTEPLSFKKIRKDDGIEQTRLLGQIKLLVGEKEILEFNSKKELETLKKAFELRLNSLDKRIKKKERIYSEVFEPKMKLKKEKIEKKKIKGGKIDGANW